MLRSPRGLAAHASSEHSSESITEDSDPRAEPLASPLGEAVWDGYRRRASPAMDQAASELLSLCFVHRITGINPIKMRIEIKELEESAPKFQTSTQGELGDP